MTSLLVHRQPDPAALASIPSGWSVEAEGGNTENVFNVIIIIIFKSMPTLFISTTFILQLLMAVHF